MASYINANLGNGAEDIIAADSGVIRDVATSVRSVKDAVDANESEFSSAENTLSEAFVGPGSDILQSCLQKIKSYNATVAEGLNNLGTALDNYADTVDQTKQSILDTINGTSF